jgi:uncharacterized membrane protein
VSFERGPERLSVRQRLVWPGIIVALAIVLNMMMVAQITGLARVLIALIFLLVCPGMAFLPLLHIQDRTTEFAIGIGLSLVANMLVTLLMVYANIWSIQLGMALILGLSAIGVILQGIGIARDVLSTRQLRRAL